MSWAPDRTSSRPRRSSARSAAGANQWLVHTGQHYDPLLSDVFFRDLDLPAPDVSLGVGSGSHAVQTAALLVALEEEFVARPPARVIVYGDVNSTLAAALVCAKLGIPIAHVEAGLRSFDDSMPEEINRRVTDALSDLLFVTSPEGLDNLAREGVSADRMHLVGNPMIDTLLAHLDRFDPVPVRAGSACRSATPWPRSTGRRTWTRPRPRHGWSPRCATSGSGCPWCSRSTRGGGRCWSASGCWTCRGSW